MLELEVLRKPLIGACRSRGVVLHVGTQRPRSVRGVVCGGGGSGSGGGGWGWGWGWGCCCGCDLGCGCWFLARRSLVLRRETGIDVVQVALQGLVAVLILCNAVGDVLAIAGVQLAQQLRDEVLVLQRVLQGGQGGAGELAFPGGLGGVGMGLVVGVGVALDLVLEDVQVAGAQGIWAQAGGLVVCVLGDVRVGLEQVGDLDEDIGGDAVGMERLEQEERLEAGVGRHARGRRGGRSGRDRRRDTGGRAQAIVGVGGGRGAVVAGAAAGAARCCC